jgi:Fe2+ transport system protein FeoA
MHQFRRTPPGETTLSAAPLRRPLIVADTPDDPDCAHRLLTLGWRPGAHVAVIRQTTGGARVVALSGARVAIGGPLARTLHVTEPAPTPHQTTEPAPAPHQATEPPAPRQTTEAAA